MKKAMTMVSSFIHMMARPSAENKSDKMLIVNNLPIAVKFFVQRYFPNSSIAFAEVRFTSEGMRYVAYLNDGNEVEFNKEGIWEMVDCKSGVVPAYLIPDSVAAFIDAYYSGTSISKIEKIGNDYEVTFSNYITLKFSKLENVA